MVLANLIIVVDLGRCPVWHSPPVPSYAEFAELSQGFEGFPWQGAPAYRFGGMEFDGMLLDLLLYLGSNLVWGLYYLAIRGDQRDLTLHCALFAGIALITCRCLLRCSFASFWRLGFSCFFWSHVCIGRRCPRLRLL